MWLTALQWAEMTGRSSSTIQRVIERGVRNGTVEMRVFQVQKNTRIYPTPHYRVVQ